MTDPSQAVKALIEEQRQRFMRETGVSEEKAHAFVYGAVSGAESYAPLASIVRRAVDSAIEDHKQVAR